MSKIMKARYILIMEKPPSITRNLRAINVSEPDSLYFVLL